MLLNSIILAISSSIDSLGIGITYGIKGTSISRFSKIILFIISFVITNLSLFIGNIIKLFCPENWLKIIGSFILIIMGVFIFLQSLKNEFKIFYAMKIARKSKNSHIYPVRSFPPTGRKFLQYKKR